MPRRIPNDVSPVDLRPKNWRPSEERKAEIDQYLWDREVVRVYCGCSASHSLKAFGITTAIVHDGSVIVRSRKAYDQGMQLFTTVGELQAVLYAIEQVNVVLSDVASIPETVSIYSDVDHITYLLHDEGPKTFRNIRRQMAISQVNFTNRWPTINLRIYHLPPGEQKHNPYYATAHNAARREISAVRR